jgi:tetrahydromethanopterin S-methyltransferase subunit E
MKIMITLVLGTVIASISFSQLSIGFHVSAVLSDAKIKPEVMIDMSQSKKITAGGGSTIEYTFNTKFTLHTGISYLQHGSKFKFNIPGDDTDQVAI